MQQCDERILFEGSEYKCVKEEGHILPHLIRPDNSGEPTEDELAVGLMHKAAKSLNKEIRKVAERGMTVTISSLAIDTFGRINIPVVHINAEKRQSVRGFIKVEEP